MPGTDGVTHALIKCYECNIFGHYKDRCPETTEHEAVQMLQVGNSPDEDDAHSEYEEAEPYVSEFTFLNCARPDILLHQADASLIPDSWILLDSQSTVSVFNNRKLLRDIRQSPNTLRVHTNGGTQLSTQLGTVPNFGDVWFNPASLANILSMAAVRKKCRITMDTSVEAAMHVHRQDGTIMKFQEYRSGLYFYDAGSKFSNRVSNYLFLNTVAENKYSYTPREIQGADRARVLYRNIGRPSESEFTAILEQNLIRNCPVTPDDARRALIPSHRQTVKP